MARGLSRANIYAHVELGGLTRIRRGWFAVPGCLESARRAVALGGRLGCVSGCRAHGVFVPPDNRLHLVHGQGAEVRPAPDVAVHPLGGPQPREALCSLLDCLDHVIHRHDSVTALVCLESAVNRGLIRPSVAQELIDCSPHRARRGLQHFHPAAESGSETVVRAFLMSHRVSVRPQVNVAGVGRVDLLVGRSLIIECDSELYHSGTIHTDRQRDLMARRLGYTIVRLSWEQVWLHWDETRRFLLDLVRTRRHVNALRPLAWTSLPH